MKQIYKGKVLSSVTAINDTISSKIATYSSEKIDSLIDNTYTKEESDNRYLQSKDISMKADKSEIPTKVSDLDNDSGYITDISGKANVGDSYTKSESDAKYITDISGKADKTSVYTKSESDSKFDGKANVATTLSGYGITDAKIENGTITLGSNTIKPITDVSGKANIGDSYTKSETYTKQEVINTIVNKVSELIANSDTDFDTLQEMSAWLSAHKNTAAEMNEEINKKYEKPSDGIPKTDLASAVQTSLGKADTALQSETSLSLGTTTGTGNAVTSISVNGHTITQNKGTTFLTSHQDISGKLNVNGSNGTHEGVSALINKLTTGDSDPTDNDYYVAQFAGGGTTTTTYHRRPISKLWEYIKGKISSVLGLTATNYGGTATNATNLKVSNHDVNNTTYYPIWANGKGDGSTARGTYTSTDLNYIPATGNFKSKQFTVGGEVSLQWNPTTKSLDFTFA